MVSKVLSDVEEPKFIKVAENVAHYHHENIKKGEGPQFDEKLAKVFYSCKVELENYYNEVEE